MGADVLVVWHVAKRQPSPSDSGSAVHNRHLAKMARAGNNLQLSLDGLRAPICRGPSYRAVRQLQLKPVNEDVWSAGRTGAVDLAIP